MIEIDEKLALERLNSPLNLLNRPEIIVKTIGHGNHGNGHGVSEQLSLSNEMKALIGSIAKMDGHGGSLATAKAFGMNHTVVNRYKNGKVGYGSGPAVPHEALRAKLDEKVDDIRAKALDKLLGVMGVISDEKLEKLGASSAAEVGLKMASIHEKLGPKGPVAINNQQVIIYAPKVRDEREYMTIDVEPVRD